MGGIDLHQKAATVWRKWRGLPREWAGSALDINESGS
jgi:hypothetical protein